MRRESSARCTPRGEFRSDLSGTISFIAPQAEYTPPVIYSDENRAKLVYLIEARPPAARASLLNPGQPVAVQPLAKREAP